MIANRDLLRKYSVAGPRYTSYPTVPYWDRNPTQNEWVASIAECLQDSERQGLGTSIYIHVPFCRQLCTYCGCNTRITRSATVAQPYVENLVKEWRMYLQLLGRTAPVPLSEIHIGGGTPTFLMPEQLNFLIEGILGTGRVMPRAEFSFEADPRVTTDAHLSTLLKLGFTRLSLGIQDFDPKVQDIVHRVQSEELVHKVTDSARAMGYSSVSYDLIYGLPLQTLESVSMTFDAILRLKPDRIAFYGYAHVPWIKPGQRRFTEADLPSPELRRELYELGRQKLEEQGYHEIGMDHFALPSDALFEAARTGTLHRNFMGYTPRQVAPMIGLGVSSIGDSWGVFSQNEKTVEAYTKHLDANELPMHRGHVLDAEDKILRRHILNVMTKFQTQWGSAETRVPFLDSVPARLADLQSDGLVELTPTSCKVLDKGMPFVRNIAMAFDARLARKAPETVLFSKTI